MDKEIFDLGDYVITKEGYRGYIVDTLDSEDFKEKNNVEYFLNWVKENIDTVNTQSKSLFIQKSIYEATNNDYDFQINKNDLNLKLKRINLFLKHQKMNELFCHKVQSKIINDLNINIEKKLYPVNNELFTEKISNDLSVKMFNQLNKDQIDFLYENSFIDSKIYFNLSNDVNV